VSDPLYRRDLLRLAADAHGAGRLPSPDVSGLAYNPACGDKVVIDLDLDDGRIVGLAHETKACVLTQASASILGTTLKGADKAAVEELHAQVSAMLEQGPPPKPPFDIYAAFSGAAEYKSRHRCVLLPIEAVRDALAKNRIDQMENNVAQARRWFAEDLRIAAGITDDTIVSAFARVPRETFIGPAPWRIGTRVMKLGGQLLEYHTFEGDPAVLYHDVVVALDEQREINNGQPSLWARLFQDVAPRAGERILHLGCGTGYYTAILAEIVGGDGSIHGVEVDPNLAKRAEHALTSWPNATVALGDGATVPPGAWDLIVVSAGATHPLHSWLDGLAPNGRLLFPLTADGPNPRNGSGAMLLVSRSGGGVFAARFVAPATFVHFEGGRAPEDSARLLQALRQGFHRLAEVRSLRRDEHAPDETCWLHADTFCLSYRAAL